MDLTMLTLLFLQRTSALIWDKKKLVISPNDSDKLKTFPDSL